MSYYLCQRIEVLPPMSNQNLRGHWRARAAKVKVVKTIVKIFTVRHKPDTPLNKAILRLTRLSSTRPDYDGLVSGFKPVIDALVEVGILINDTFDVIGIPTYEWEKSKRGKGAILIEVKSP